MVQETNPTALMEAPIVFEIRECSPVGYPEVKNFVLPLL